MSSKTHSESESQTMTNQVKINLNQDPRLDYYVKGGCKITGERYELLGFKDNSPVVNSYFNLNQINIKKIITKPTLQVDKIGGKFINLNGKKLIVVPKGQIPEEITKHTLMLKKKLPIINNNSSPPLVQMHQSAPCKDNPENILITSSTTVSSNSNISGDVCVNPLDLSEPLLGGNLNPLKLLSTNTIKILKQVKMQALNLSIKDIKVKEDKAMQTELSNKEYTDQMVQTDFQSSNKPNFDTFMSFDFDELLGESPLLNDVNLGQGPSMGKVILADNNCVQSSNSIGHNFMCKHEGEDVMKKRLMFFKDLRECLVYNINGSLPIHEGVINNNLSLVKRNCIALKMRNIGVNLENHNGCDPLQLAIIHNVNVQIVQTLLDAGADLNEIDGDGNNILHLVAKFERLEMLEVILSHCEKNGLLEMADRFNFEGLTPLMICCTSSWTAGAERFVEAGVNVDLKDQTSGRTALFHAAECQNAEIVRLLLQYKADPKIKNFFGTSPHDAMYELEDMPEVIKSLIFGISRKRSIEAEMNPVRTAKAAKSLKTFSRLQKIAPKAVRDPLNLAKPASSTKFKRQRQFK